MLGVWGSVWNTTREPKVIHCSGETYTCRALANSCLSLCFSFDATSGACPCPPRTSCSSLPLCFPLPAPIACWFSLLGFELLGEQETCIMHCIVAADHSVRLVHDRHLINTSLRNEWFNLQFTQITLTAVKLILNSHTDVAGAHRTQPRMTVVYLFLPGGRFWLSYCN